MIPALVENQARFCELCGRASSDRHHILHRAQGGTDHDHNLADICRQCHQNCHRQGNDTWNIERTGEVIRAITVTGDVKVERWLQPEGFDEGLLVAEFYNAPQGIMERVPLFKYLSDDGIKAVGEALTKIGTAAWIARGMLAKIARLHSPYGDRMDVLNALAGDSGVSLSTLYREEDALNKAMELGIDFASLQNWTPQAVRLAAQQADTERAKEIHEELASQGVAGKRGAFSKALADEGMTEKPEEIRYHTVTCECGAVISHRVKE